MLNIEGLVAELEDRFDELAPAYKQFVKKIRARLNNNDEIEDSDIDTLKQIKSEL